ncbi:hypothetical protein TRFO_19205 [Tritrichomonas foetus]|uniref:Condensation domain-containing protein n=1 Tax=Tritrichomonas foetus TaxID=1144522 RepID=A0A1J4KJV4_9EUKA|nr:hypothetical protein TRFO_19205 [Tritrichomonas foetus]|eukprot:OHT11394.1 hypothetical protein TRFO_19205 [Tritrichomonas foetus]
MRHCRKIQRPLDDFDKYFISDSALEMVQLAIEVKHPKFVNSVLNTLTKNAIGLHIKTDGVNLIREEGNLINQNSQLAPINVLKIPENQKNKNCDELCEWMYETHQPDFSKSLATIAADDHRVVLNSSHMCADGGYLLYLLNKCMSDLEKTHSNSSFNESSHKNNNDNKLNYNSDENDFYLPGSVSELMKDELEEAKNSKLEISDDLTYTPLNLFEKQSSRRSDQSCKLDSERASELNHDVDIESFSRRIMEAAKNAKKTTYISNKSDASTFQCYDKNSKTLKGLSEYIWTGLSLIMCARNGKIGPIGINTCVDFRRFTNKYQNNEKLFCNSFTCINVVSEKKVNENMTIEEVAHEMRKNFDYLMKNKGVFVNYYRDPTKHFKPNFIFPHISNMGPIKFKDPIADFCMAQRMNEEAASGALAILSYSKCGNGINEVNNRLLYSPSFINEKDGHMLIDALMFFLHEIPIQTKVGDALKQLIHFQNSYKY